MNDHTERPPLEIAVDEAGRGSLAFPVCAAAVLLPRGFFACDDERIHLIRDSKQLSARARDRAMDFLRAHAIGVGIGEASEREIDRLNILRATHLAMHRAVDALMSESAVRVALHEVSGIVIDGTSFPPYCVDAHAVESNPIAASRLETEGAWLPHVCIPDGDKLRGDIAAASIAAKTYRDDLIARICRAHPEIDSRYGFARNKAYGTRPHIDALQRYGTSPFHRMTFAPCARAVRGCDEVRTSNIGNAGNG